MATEKSRLQDIKDIMELFVNNPVLEILAAYSFVEYFQKHPFPFDPYTHWEYRENGKFDPFLNTWQREWVRVGDPAIPSVAGSVAEAAILPAVMMQQLGSDNALRLLQSMGSGGIDVFSKIAPLLLK